jgi:hypothetical protein
MHVVVYVGRVEDRIVHHILNQTLTTLLFLPSIFKNPEEFARLG